MTDALLKNYSPSFFSVELNPNFPIDAAMAFPNDKDEFWHNDRVMGSSLKALSMMPKTMDIRWFMQAAIRRQNTTMPSLSEMI